MVCPKITTVVLTTFSVYVKATEAKGYTNYAKSTIISTQTQICLIKYNSIKTKLICQATKWFDSSTVTNLHTDNSFCFFFCNLFFNYNCFWDIVPLMFDLDTHNLQVSKALKLQVWILYNFLKPKRLFLQDPIKIPCPLLSIFPLLHLKIRWFCGHWIKCP